MGKLSSIFLTFLMMNIIGYLLMATAIEEGFATPGSNVYANSQTLLGTLYSPYTDASGNTVYLAGNNSELFGSVPQNPPQNFITSVGQFIDRIFVIFDFVRIMLAVLLFPIALITFMGIPYQITLLFITPLTALYIIGFFDLISGGDN